MKRSIVVEINSGFRLDQLGNKVHYRKSFAYRKYPNGIKVLHLGMVSFYSLPYKYSENVFPAR